MMEFTLKWRDFFKNPPTQDGQEILVRTSPHWRGNMNSYIYDHSRTHLIHVRYYIGSPKDEKDVWRTSYLQTFEGDEIPLKWGNYGFSGSWVPVDELGVHSWPHPDDRRKLTNAREQF